MSKSGLPAVADTSGATAERSAEIGRRQCGRCRRWFPGDATLDPTVRAEWWACPACRDALLGGQRSNRRIHHTDETSR